MSILRSLVASLALASAAWGQTPPPDPTVPFAEFAEAFKKAHHIEVAEAVDFDAQAVLARGWLVERVGIFDVLYPRQGLEAKPRQDELRGLVACILDLESLWLEWFGTGAPADAARADIALLKKWIGSAKAAPAKLGESNAGLFAFFSATDKETAAAARLVTAFSDSSALGYAPRGEVRPQILFAPTRKEFLDVVAFFGWVDPERRESFWDQGAARWSECFWNSIQVLSLEDPPSKVNPAAPWAGVTMNVKAATGVGEHVATRSAHSLCTTYFGYSLDAAFQSGLCQNTAIAIYGRNNSRSGGSGRGNTVDGWSMFIPGGNKHGGLLPGFSADSTWRATAGADWFIRPLRDSQRMASKDATRGVEKTSTFELTALDGVKKLFVRAPFLGQAATVRDLPAQEFLSDYREFFRAYQSCFAHYLMEEGAGKTGKPSRAKLAEFLRTFAAAAEGAVFEEQLSLAYAMPWSAPEPKPESLEWNFLTWLSRQR